MGWALVLVRDRELKGWDNQKQLKDGGLKRWTCPEIEWLCEGSVRSLTLSSLFNSLISLSIRRDSSVVLQGQGKVQNPIRNRENEDKSAVRSVPCCEWLVPSPLSLPFTANCFLRWRREDLSIRHNLYPPTVISSGECIRTVSAIVVKMKSRALEPISHCELRDFGWHTLLLLDKRSCTYAWITRAKRIAISRPRQVDWLVTADWKGDCSTKCRKFFCLPVGRNETTEGDEWADMNEWGKRG